jgi:putative transposase
VQQLRLFPRKAASIAGFEMLTEHTDLDVLGDKAYISADEAVRQVSRLHEKIANQRSDYWHKITRDLATSHALIAVEDLKLKFMNRDKYLSLSLHDAGLGSFTQLLAYKVEETGCQLVAVNPANTSQMCSNCGSIVEKGLSVRVHKCDDCGFELARDVNAVRNVLQKAFNLLGLSDQDLTWAVASSVS